jgi:probable F420-dependent oxidoreductase
VEIGVHLPSAGPFATAGDILAVATVAEGLRFDAVWAFDHLFTPTSLSSPYPYTPDGSYPIGPDQAFFDPVGLLAYLAGVTDRIRLGTSVLVGAYRHPIVLGKMLATVANLAPGRLVCGIGAGWMREEFDALGVGFERRGARLEEYVGALRAIWSGRPAGFDGEFYRWPEAGFLPAPKAPITLILGGHADAAVARAARVGDGWAAATVRGQGSGLEGLEGRVRLLRERLQAEGRGDEPFDVLYQGFFGFSERALPRLPLYGPPEAIADSLRGLDGMGVTMVDLWQVGPAATAIANLRRFAEEVRPLL